MASQTTTNAPHELDPPVTRRDFLKTSFIVAATATVAGGCATTPKGGAGPAISAGGRKPELLRVGVIGCGGRGTGAAIDCVRSSPNVAIVALGDLFPDRLDECRKKLTAPEDEKLADIPAKTNITDERCFTGFDAYTGVLACDIDLVILAAPPGFRPPHLRAAVEAGKHVFMEKPVAVDPVGVRAIIAAAELAATKRLAIVSGTQRRHQPLYLETLKRVHGGAIGEIVAAECYWNQGDLWVKEQKPEWSDMEWQCRNWLYFTWLSGDHIVEQHVHNIDVINWAMKSPPVKCVGMGGRQVRTEPKYGNIFDHFAVEYEYPGGARVLSTCRQIKGCSERVAERLVGTKGTAYTDSRNAEICGHRSKKPWKYEPPQDSEQNPYVLEHADLIASIRRSQPLNEGRRVAESTLTAIMGRMSAYTGRELSWEWAMNASQLDLTPPKYELGELAVEPVAIPGETKLV